MVRKKEILEDTRLSGPDEAYESDSDVACALSVIRSGVKGILISGRAGTGKSKLISYIKNLPDGARTVVVAPTGIAALNLGGSTIHSFFKLPLGVLDASNLEPIKNNLNRIAKIWKKMDRLIIDEISMVRADVLDAIDARLRQVRGNDDPFGGLQVIMVGDFMQLAPVVRREEESLLRSLGYETPYAFSSFCLTRLQLSMVALSKVWRQSDPSFLRALADIRVGRYTKEAVSWFNAQCFGAHRATRKPLLLTATKASANAHNEDGIASAIQKNEGVSFTYEAEVLGEFDASYFPAPQYTVLTPGARVMSIRNASIKEGTYVNGSLGYVILCETGTEPSDIRVHVVFDDTPDRVSIIETHSWLRVRQTWSEEEKRLKEEVLGSFRQIPLVAGYAVTIHKSQGLSLSDARIDMGRGAFSAGQLYVALSRARTLEGLSFSNPLRERDAMVEKMTLTFLDWMGKRMVQSDGQPIFVSEIFAPQESKRNQKDVLT